jgi:CO/xanthine dehydrogenase FAD-binding subunit
VITEYHRPKKLAEALELLERKEPHTRPLGGGTVLSAPHSEEYAVVDLQNLGLDKLSAKGKSLSMGAALPLQALIASPAIPTALAAAIKHEANYSQRQVATVAGSLVSADGRSAFAIAMLALDAQLSIEPAKEKLGYGELLPLREQTLAGKLITKITLSGQPQLAYEYVARSPADRPIVALALARWPSDRTRLAVGGFGDLPQLAVDGQDDSGLIEALQNVLDGATDDWATSDYRKEAALALLRRALAKFEKTL